jgi:hypothetical protein
MMTDIIGDIIIDTMIDIIGVMVTDTIVTGRPIVTT